jgi:hypothetical protein
VSIVGYFSRRKLKSTIKALAQIKTPNYAAKYPNSGKVIYLLGIAFDETIRNGC